jgi:hypothetical protein
MQWAGSERAATGRAPLTPSIRGSIAGSTVSSQGGGTRAPGKSCSRCLAARATGSTGMNERRKAPKAALSPTGLNHHRIRAEKIAATAAFGGNGAPGRIRTHDPQIRSLVLYPAELRAQLKCLGRPRRPSQVRTPNCSKRPLQGRRWISRGGPGDGSRGRPADRESSPRTPPRPPAARRA